MANEAMLHDKGIQKLSSLYRRIFRVLVLELLAFPFYWASFLLPRSSKLWVFGNANGSFADNSRYVMEYLRENRRDIQTHWLARSLTERDTVRKLGFSSSLLWSVEGIKTMCRAKIGFEMNGHGDLNRFFLGGVHIIQLWHGSPLKRVALDARPSKNFLLLAIDRMRAAVFPYASTRFSKVTVASPLVMQRLQTAFNLPSSAFIVTGDARADVVLRQVRNSMTLGAKLGLGDKKGTVLFAPTFRGLADGSPAPSDSDLRDMDQFLSAHDAVMLVKLHHFVRNTAFAKMFTKFSAIRLVEKDECDDINLMLPFVDVLVTDYSSVMFDYALLERPIALFAPDVAEYDAERGLYEDYEQLAEGRFSRSWKELQGELSIIFDSSPQWHIDRTRRMKRRYNSYDDERNRERIVLAVEKLLDL